MGVQSVAGFLQGCYCTRLSIPFHAKKPPLPHTAGTGGFLKDKAIMLIRLMPDALLSAWR